MGNIPSREVKLPEHILLKSAFRGLIDTHIDRRISHLLTIGLVPPLSDFDPFQWNERTRCDRQEALLRIIREIDRALLGSDYCSCAWQKKVQFISIEEYHTAMGTLTHAHFHIALMVEAKWRCRFDAQWEAKILPRIAIRLRELGFDPDIHLTTADERVADYIGKNGDREETDIHTRRTLRA